MAAPTLFSGLKPLIPTPLIPTPLPRKTPPYGSPQIAPIKPTTFSEAQNGVLNNGSLSNGVPSNGSLSNGVPSNRSLSNGVPNNGALCIDVLSNGTIGIGTLSNNPLSNDVHSNDTLSSWFRSNDPHYDGARCDLLLQIDFSSFPFFGPLCLLDHIWSIDHIWDEKKGEQNLAPGEIIVISIISRCHRRRHGRRRKQRLIQSRKRRGNSAS